MKNKVRVLNSTYKVVPEKGIVVCILNCTTSIYDTELWPNVNYEWWTKKLHNVDWRGEFIVRAKAKCGKDDKFDEVIGKRIAESRAKAKAYATASKLWDICETKILELANFCNARVEACDLARKKEAEHVIELCNL